MRRLLIDIHEFESPALRRRTIFEAAPVVLRIPHNRMAGGRILVIPERNLECFCHNLNVSAKALRHPDSGPE